MSSAIGTVQNGAELGAPGDEHSKSPCSEEGDIGVCGVAVLVNFSSGISVILILNCDIAVFSESAGWGISSVLVNDI